MRKTKDRISVKGILGVILMLVIIVSLVYMLIKQGKTNEVANSQPVYSETVSGSGQGFKGPINATLTFEQGRITDLKLTGDDETPDIGQVALETLTQEILQNGTTNGVDAITGATYSSQGAFDAIADAMTKLRGRTAY